MATNKFIPKANYIVRHTGVTTNKPMPQPSGPPMPIVRRGHVLTGEEVTEYLGDGARLVGLGAIEEAHPQEVRDWRATQKQIMAEEVEEGAVTDEDIEAAKKPVLVPVPADNETAAGTDATTQSVPNITPEVKATANAPAPAARAGAVNAPSNPGPAPTQARRATSEVKPQG